MARLTQYSLVCLPFKSTDEVASTSLADSVQMPLYVTTRGFPRTSLYIFCDSMMDV